MEVETLQLHFVSQVLVSSTGGEEGRESAPHQGLCFGPQGPCGANADTKTCTKPA